MRYKQHKLLLTTRTKVTKKQEVTSKLKRFFKINPLQCLWVSLPAPMPKPALQSRGSRSRSPLPEISLSHLNILTWTVSGSCPHATHTVTPGLVYHKALPALNSEIAEAFCTHTPKPRARAVIKIGCPAESIFLLMVSRVGGSLSSSSSLLQLVDAGSQPSLARSTPTDVYMDSEHGALQLLCATEYWFANLGFFMI